MEPPEGASPRIEVALRRVVVGYRSVGALWLALLALVALRPGDGAVDTTVVVAAVALAVGWTLLTGVMAARRPEGLASLPFLVIDTAVSAAVLVAPTAAGADAFYGGYPFSSVLLAATMRGLPAGLPVGGVLAAVAVGRLSAEGTGALPDTLGLVLLYLLGAGLAAWGAGVLRAQDAERRAAETRLAVERTARIRSQERAETAAHLHDSVLQTLALIQRRSDDAAEVTALARRSERELRTWLGGGRPSGAPRCFADAVAAAAAEIEGAHHVTVEVVTVGDAPLDDDLGALVAAAREALVNAAVHAGVGEVAVYAEAGGAAAEIFVRDRGVGFDPSAVPADRRGIAESIHGRLHRHGGSAEIRSAPGRGTEVQLRLPARG
jgi:signal transduction histidine kinase